MTVIQGATYTLSIGADDDITELNLTRIRLSVSLLLLADHQHELIMIVLP